MQLIFNKYRFQWVLLLLPFCHVAVANGAANQSAPSEFSQASLLSQQGQTDAAEALYRQLITQFPQAVAPYNNLAVLLTRRGDLDGARIVLEQGLRSHESYRTLYNNLNQVVTAQARSNYAKALNVNNAGKGIELTSLERWNDLGAPLQVATVSDEVVPTALPVMASLTPMETEPRSPVAAQPQDVLPMVADAKVVASGADSPVRDTQGATQQAVDGVDRYSPASISQWVAGWARAWEQQRMGAYVAYYGANFSPSSAITHTDWVADRTRRIVGKSHITISLSDLLVSSLDGDRYRVDFVMGYRSDNYADRTIKRLELMVQDGQLRIVREVTLKVLS